MEDREYVIKGTLEGMSKILEQDFNMSPEEAQFFIYAMIDRHRGEAVNAVNEEELDAWYLEPDKYTGQIGNTHLVINFTDIDKTLCHMTFLLLTKYFFSREIDLVLIGADLISLIIRSIQKIEDTDYCVYSRIIELCIGNKNRLFKINDVVTANKDGDCDYQAPEWHCTYLSQQSDSCTCNAERVKLTFQHLSQQNIIKPVGEQWMLVQ